MAPNASQNAASTGPPVEGQHMASKDTAGIRRRGQAVIVAALVAATLALGSALAAATPTTGRAMPAATPAMGSAIAAITVAAISDEDDCSMAHTSASFRCVRYQARPAAA